MSVSGKRPLTRAWRDREGGMASHGQRAGLGGIWKCLFASSKDAFIVSTQAGCYSDRAAAVGRGEERADGSKDV